MLFVILQKFPSGTLNLFLCIICAGKIRLANFLLYQNLWFIHLVHMYSLVSIFSRGSSKYLVMNWTEKSSPKGFLPSAVEKFLHQGFFHEKNLPIFLQFYSTAEPPLYRASVRSATIARGLQSNVKNITQLLPRGNIQCVTCASLAFDSDGLG